MCFRLGSACGSDNVMLVNARPSRAECMNTVVVLYTWYCTSYARVSNVLTRMIDHVLGGLLEAWRTCPQESTWGITEATIKKQSRLLANNSPALQLLQ